MNRATNKIELSPQHLRAVDRRRRIVDQMDANDPQAVLNIGFAPWLDFRFRHADMEGSQIDGIWWDIGFAEDTYAIYDSAILPKLDHPGLQRWWDQGIDHVAELVRACHVRGLEAFWSARICPVDFAQPWGSAASIWDERVVNPLKKEHPDWTIPCWWWQGLWNFASEGYRAHRVAVLRELAERYEFDGFQLDFARHAPCLPLGQQWELRDHLTSFVRTLRETLLEVERSEGHSILLAAKVPENLDGCRIDGLDVERWAAEQLVDIFVLGGRTMTVDVSAFREIVHGSAIKLCPSWDAHHSSDGYCSPPVEIFRGIFSNWGDQGADSVGIFNWPCAPQKDYESLGPEADAGIVPSSHPPHTEALRQIGSPQTLQGKHKTFAVERLGGYPWSDEETYHCRNADRPLPCPVANHGTPVQLPLYVYDELAAQSDRIRTLSLQVVLSAASSADVLAVELDGQALEQTDSDPAWKDGQIYADKPQPDAGAVSAYGIDSDQQLLRLVYTVDPEQCRRGENVVSIRVLRRGCYPCDMRGSRIRAEKVELSVRYR